MDSILPYAIAQKEKKKDRFDEDIIKSILNQEEVEAQVDKPLKIYSESLKGYIEDLKKLQKEKNAT